MNMMTNAGEEAWKQDEAKQVLERFYAEWPGIRAWEREAVERQTQERTMNKDTTMNTAKSVPETLPAKSILTFLIVMLLGELEAAEAEVKRRDRAVMWLTSSHNRFLTMPSEVEGIFEAWVISSTEEEPIHERSSSWVEAIEAAMKKETGNACCD